MAPSIFFKARLAAWATVAVLTVSADSFAGNEPPVRLRGAEYLGDLPTLVADARGWFETAGVTVDYGLSGKANLASLRAGEVDVTVMAMTPLVIDHLRDPTPGGADDPVILANLAYSTRINHVVTLRAITPAAIDRVGLAKGTNAEVLWSLFGAYHALAPEQATVVDLDVDRIPVALAGGEIDAAVTWEPWTTRLRLEHGVDLRILPGSTVYTTRWLLVARRDWATRCAATCRDILHIYGRAEAAIEADPAAARAVFARHWNVPLSLMGELAHLPIYDVTLDWTVFASFRQQWSWAVRAGYAAADRRASLFDVLDPGPLRAAAPGNVSLPSPPGDAAMEAAP